MAIFASKIRTVTYSRGPAQGDTATPTCSRRGHDLNMLSKWSFSAGEANWNVSPVLLSTRNKKFNWAWEANGNNRIFRKGFRSLRIEGSVLEHRRSLPNSNAVMCKPFPTKSSKLKFIFMCCSMGCFPSYNDEQYCHMRPESRNKPLPDNGSLTHISMRTRPKEHFLGNGSLTLFGDSAFMSLWEIIVWRGVLESLEAVVSLRLKNSLW
jgi:hypothetical protein